MEYNFKMHFYLKTGKLNVKGQAPVYLRLTLNGLRTEISTNQSILPVNWNRHIERAKGNREEVRIFNNCLDSLALKANRCYNDLISNGENFNINDLKDILNGKGRINKTLVQIYEENNRLMKLEEGTSYTAKTVGSYANSLERLKKFLHQEFNTQDIPLDKLNYQFVKRHEVYLVDPY